MKFTNVSLRIEIKFFQDKFIVRLKLIKRKKIVTIVDPIVAKYGIKKFLIDSPIKPEELSG